MTNAQLLPTRLHGLTNSASRMPSVSFVHSAFPCSPRGSRFHEYRKVGWRYIRYANGDDELYNETSDPNEWTNLAKDPQYAGVEAELAKHLPAKNQPEIRGKAGVDEDADNRAKQKNKKAKAKAKKAG
jgi:hypothetical protein